METILELVGQLYNQNATIRRDAEEKLNIHHREATSLYVGLDAVITLRGAIQLQYFTYLKHFIQARYEHTQNYIKRELQQCLLSKIHQIDPYIQPQFCQLVVFIILKSLPDCDLMHRIIEQETYDSTTIQVITQMLNNLNIKNKISHSKYKQITQKMVLFCDIANIVKMELFVDLYRACTRQIYQLSDDVHSIIVIQLGQYIHFQPMQQELIRRFCKAVRKLNVQKLPSLDVQTLLYNALIIYLNHQIDRRIVYQILKLLQSILPGRQLRKEEQTILLEYTFLKLIMLSPDEYRRQSNSTTEEGEDYLLLKLRKYGTEFLHFLLTYFNEEYILGKILDIRIDDSQIMKEARYFVISEILSYYPAYMMDMLFVQELIMIVAENDINLVPVKMQALRLLVKLQAKDLVDKNQLNRLIAIIRMNVSQCMLQPLCLCKMVDVLISFHTIQPINTQVYKDLIALYDMQKTLIVKEAILKCMAKIYGLGLGDHKLLKILEQEWQIGQNEVHQYKYRLKMVLNVLYLIEDTQTILNILQDCFRRKVHQQQCLAILNSLLMKLIKSKTLVSQFSQQLTQIHLSLNIDPEYFEQILQTNLLFLIAEVADLDRVFDFINNFTPRLQNFECLSILSILFSTIQGHEDQITNYYCSMLKEMIYDGGKTYSEMICGLAILDIRGYDIKELWMIIKRQIPSEQMLGTMISKASTYVLESNDNYVNYMIHFLNSLLHKHHLMFDMEQLSLANSGLSQQISNALQQLDKQNSFDLRDVINKIFTKKFKLNFQMCPQLAKKFTIPGQSVELDLQQLQIE